MDPLVTSTIDWKFLLTTVIRFKNNNDGTGFFYKSNGTTYLVTNKHVLKDEGHEPKYASIYLRKKGNYTSYERISLELYDEDKSLNWFEHIVSEIDLAIIPLDISLPVISEISDTSTDVGNIALSKNEFVPKGRHLYSGSSVFIIGYPVEYIDSKSYFPVVIDGTVGSPHGYYFDDKPYFLTNARTYGGMSGSPVLTGHSKLEQRSDGELLADDVRNHFLGVHQGKYNLSTRSRMNDDDHNHNEKLDLGIVWYGRLVEEISEVHQFIEGGPIPEFILEIFTDVFEFELSEEFIENLDETMSYEEAVEKFSSIFASMDDFQFNQFVDTIRNRQIIDLEEKEKFIQLLRESVDTQ